MAMFNYQKAKVQFFFGDLWKTRPGWLTCSAPVKETPTVKILQRLDPCWTFCVIVSTTRALQVVQMFCHSATPSRRCLSGKWMVGKVPGEQRMEKCISSEFFPNWWIHPLGNQMTSLWLSGSTLGNDILIFDPQVLCTSWSLRSIPSPFGESPGLRHRSTKAFWLECCARKPAAAQTPEASSCTCRAAPMAAAVRAKAPPSSKRRYKVPAVRKNPRRSWGNLDLGSVARWRLVETGGG